MGGIAAIADPCAMNTLTPEERERYNRTVVKPYYQHAEDYDWTDVTDRLRGPEALMHRFRIAEMRRALRRWGARPPFCDIGCGSGLLLRHLPAGSTGIDINPRCVARARRYAPHANILLGDAESLSLPDRSFHTICMTEMLEHLVYPERALEEAHRVLLPSGLLAGSVPRKTRFWKIRRISATCPGTEPFHREMTRQELRKLLEEGGFLVRRIWRGFWFLQNFFVAQKATQETQ
jgi:SAM-dependent methyltransferase